MMFICKTQFRETLEAYESPNAPRTIKTTVFKSCYKVKEIPECCFNLATQTYKILHLRNSFITPFLPAVALQPVLC